MSYCIMNCAGCRYIPLDGRQFALTSLILTALPQSTLL